MGLTKKRRRASQSAVETGNARSEKPNSKLSNEQLAEKMSGLVIQPQRKGNSKGSFVAHASFSGKRGRRRSVQDMHFEAIVGLATTINESTSHLKDILTYHKLSAVKVSL